jgi:hypothetical protein
MRTFPRCLATFREMVNKRGEQLRKLAPDDLRKLASAPTEKVTVVSRPSTISIIVEPKPDGSLRVVVQGFMHARFVPFLKHVAMDGFYKHSDGTVTPMRSTEFCEFD